MLLLESERPTFLALQETRRKPTSRPAVIPGYDVVESPVDSSLPGAHGVLVALRRSEHFSVSEFMSTPYLACLRVVARQPNGPPKQLLVASVYIPVTEHKLQRIQALRGIPDLLEKAAKEGIDNIITLGDFNMSPRLAGVKCKGVWNPLTYVPSPAPPKTTPRRRRTGHVDHILVSEHLTRHTIAGNRLFQCHISDH